MSTGKNRKQGFHEDFSREQAPQPGSTRSFAVTMAVVLGGVGLYFLYQSQPLALVFLAVAAAFLALEWLLTPVLEPLNWLWFKFGMLLGRVMAPLVMGLVFFLVVTPIGLIRRLGGADSLHLKRNPARDSWWQDRAPPEPDPDQLPRQF